jgi:hypothetical protein
MAMGFHDVRFAGDEFDFKAIGHRHLAESFLRRVRLIGRLILSPREHVRLGTRASLAISNNTPGKRCTTS